MVTFKWLNSVLLGNRPEVDQAAAGHASEEIKKKDARTRPIDLVNAAFVDRAEKLGDLISGAPFNERKKLKQKIKKKVKKVIAEEYSDPEIIEEVTERITDAAEIDPFYKNLFYDE